MGFFPFWSLAISKLPVAEMIYPNRKVEYYRIKLINREFFIIDKLGVFRISDGIAKIYNGKVRIYQYNVESMNPIDARVIEDIHKFCHKNKFNEILPLMIEYKGEGKEGGALVDEKGVVVDANPYKIQDPISSRGSLFLHNFQNIDPVHVYNFYNTVRLAGKEADKLKSAKLMPKIEAKFIFAILVGSAIAIAVIVPTLTNSSIDLDFFIPKALKGEFLLGLKNLL